jgi:YD repeat-containing protein
MTKIAGNVSGQSAEAVYDDALGRVTKTTYGTGARTEVGYNASGELTKISHYSATGALFASNAYQYDPAGVVTRMALADDVAYSGSAAVTYQYDALYRLTRETCAPGQDSARDANRPES